MTGRRSGPRVRHDSEVALAAAVSALAALLERQAASPGEPHGVAHDFMRQLLADGWRPTTAYVAAERPTGEPPATPEQGRAYAAHIRRKLEGSDQ